MLQFVLGKPARRDYAGALQIMDDSTRAAAGRSSVGKLSMLLHLLEKNGRIDDARALIKALDKDAASWSDKDFSLRPVLPPPTAAR